MADICKTNILSDQSGVFPISLGGCEAVFVKKSPKNGTNSEFSKKIILSDLVTLYSLSFKLGYYLILLCKISASNSQ